MMEEELRQQIKAAIRASLVGFQQAHPSEVMAGYALLTDDDLATVGHIAVTSEALVTRGDPDLLFCPTDWPYESDVPDFDVLSERMSALWMNDNPKMRLDRVFGLLVDALCDCRSDGLFSPRVFLSVLSTDPSPYLESLEAEGIRRLNEAGLVKEREQFIERWR